MGKSDVINASILEVENNQEQKQAVLFRTASKA